MPISRQLAAQGHHIWAAIKANALGIAIAVALALGAKALAALVPAPSMLLALLLGMALSFANDRFTAVKPGVNFSANIVLKFGIVLLGLRISADLVLSLGWAAFGFVIATIILTMAFGIIAGRVLGLSLSVSVLTAGAVSICGSSAALAISTVLPKDDTSEKNLLMTIVVVTALSTVAMGLYPFILSKVFVDQALMGKILGGSIHNVPQAVGAGFSLSPQAGEAATLIKLTRVSLLAPVIIVLSLFFSKSSATPTELGARPPILPLFIAGFIILAILNSLGWIPNVIKAPAVSLSQFALLTAIAAIGLKTNIRQAFTFGLAPLILVTLQTLFLATLTVVGFGVLA